MASGPVLCDLWIIKCCKGTQSTRASAAQFYLKLNLTTFSLLNLFKPAHILVIVRVKTRVKVLSLLVTLVSNQINLYDSSRKCLNSYFIFGAKSLRFGASGFVGPDNRSVKTFGRVEHIKFKHFHFCV